MNDLLNLSGPENDSSEDVERNSTLEDSNEAVRFFFVFCTFSLLLQKVKSSILMFIYHNFFLY